MKVLAEFDDIVSVQPFIDYMAQKNIHLQLKPVENRYQLLMPERYLLQSRQIAQELSLFMMNPDYVNRQPDPWETLPEVKKRSQFKGLQFNRSLWRQIKTSGLVTISMIIICIIVYLFQLTLGNWTVFYYLRFNVVLATEKFEIWRLLTPIFMHFSLLHIAFNLAMWWNLALRFETVLGRFKLIELVVIGGIVANIAQYLHTGANFGGLSGVVFALIGYIWLYGQLNSYSQLRLEGGLLLISVLWIIAGYSGFLENMGNSAHLGGLITGLILAFKDVYLLKVRK